MRELPAWEFDTFREMKAHIEATPVRCTWEFWLRLDDDKWVALGRPIEKPTGLEPVFSLMMPRKEE